MQVLAPHISCVVYPNEFAEAIQAGYKEIYIITSKGILKHHQLRGTNRFVRLAVDKIPAPYQEVEINQALNFLPAGKIPYAIYEQVLSFFRKVMEVKTAELEAMIHVLWNAEQGYHLGVPNQTISKASVSYDWSYIPQGTSIIVDIHSHNTMGAFFSGTDNNDDRNNISFSGVFGKLKDEKPMTVWRFNYYDKKFDAKLEDLFEAPPIAPGVEIPDEWINKVNVQTYQYQGGNRGQGNVVGPVTGRNYDHLKQWQFPKGSNTNPGNSANQSGVRTGGHNDHMYPNGYVPGDDDDAGIQGQFFGHDEGFPQNLQDELDAYYESRGMIPHTPTPEPRKGTVWRYDPKSGTSQRADELDEAALARVVEDPTIGDDVESHLGKPMVENLHSNQTTGHMDQDLISLATGSTNHHSYEYIAQMHGTDVADAWFAISQEMANLDGQDSLNIDLISDFFNHISDEGQAKLVRVLFDQLPHKEKEKLETNGF